MENQNNWGEKRDFIVDAFNRYNLHDEYLLLYIAFASEQEEYG
jgi:hypothetical protein